MFLDWIAAAVALIGVFLVGQKNKYGFLVCMLSGFCWCLVAVSTGVYGLFLEVLPLFFLNLYNFNRWRKEDNDI